MKWMTIAAVWVGAALVSSTALASEAECEAAYVRAIDRMQFPDPVAGLDSLEPLQNRCLAEDRAWLSHLAILNNLAGRAEVGEKIVADGLKADPLNENLLLSQVYVLVRHKNFAGAAEVAQRLMKAHPDWYGGYAGNQLALINLGKFRESLDYGRKALSLSQGQVPMLYLNDAVANFRSDNLSACADEVVTAVAKDPSLASMSWGIDEGIFALAKLQRRREALDLAKRRIAADQNWRNDPNMVRAAHVMGLDQ